MSGGTVTAPSTNLSVGVNLTRNLGTFTHNSGTIILNGINAQTISGMTGSNALNNITFRGAGTKSFGFSAASTTDFTIDSDSGIVTAPESVVKGLTIAGNYTNNAGDGKFLHNKSHVYFDSTSAQSLSGTMTDASSFATTTFIGSGTKTFSNNASTTAHFTINSGATVVAPSLLTVGGDYSNSGTFTNNASGILYFSSTTAQTLSGTLSGASALGTTTFIGSGTKTLSGNASTTGFTIGSGAAVVAPPLLSIAGSYANSGTFTAVSGTTTVNGTALQTLSGNMVGSSAFYNLEVINSTATTSFTSVASTTGLFFINTPNVKVEFKSLATSTFQSMFVAGTPDNEVFLFSGTPGSRWNLHATGTKSFSYARIKDSDACSNTGGLSAMNSTNGTNNVCWTFQTLVAELLHYRWRFDNGGEAGATAASAGEDLPLDVGVFVGDRRRLRIQIKNTGTGSTIAGYTYRLEYAPGACSAWTPVASFDAASSEDWTMDLSPYTNNAVATTKYADISTPAGTFVAGYLMTSANQTPAHTLAQSEYTELEYSLRSRSSVSPATTYCFRVTNAGSVANFTYTQSPQIIVKPNSARGFGGGASVESDGGGTPVGGGGPGGGGGSEGEGGGPPVGGGGSGGGGDSE